jgi:formate dehydrogenase iron-sulfur subunit
MSRALLYDSTLCVGCRQCESGCATRWNNPYNDAIASQEKLSANKLTTIRTYGDKYSRKMCMHCQQPTCASVCPVGAITKTQLGPVVYDAMKCIGCRYCMFACPFQVPTYEWSARLPRMRKCDQCYDRQAKGQVTACTEACPVGATTNGDRDALIAEARKRLAEKPDQYYQKIYGVTEVGGTSLLFLSSVPFEQIGLNVGLSGEPMPILTWRVLELVPDIAMVGSVALGGIYWITHRREEVAKAEGSSAKGGKA